MSLAGLLSVITGDPALREALDSPGTAGTVPGGDTAVAETGADFTAPPALRPFLAAALTGLPGDEGGRARQDRRFVLAVTATAREAEELTDGLSSLLPGEQVAYFPAWETLPHERISPGSETCGRRLAVLRRLAHPDPAGARTGPLSVVVTPVRGLLQPIVGGLGDIAPVSLRPGQAAGLDEVIASLVEIGYTRTDLVERRGDMAVRGGIVDVFPPTEEHPLRVEFWGDEVEEIRQFRVADQRSLQTVDRLWVPPCRELLLTPAVRERAK
ncbi:MAG TPA: transcription-repair coupling factor, partial [Streptosporangiaceae bacterium]